MSQKKSMSMEEFREALASDATKKAERLEARITELRELNGKLSREISRRKDVCRILFNRCMTLTDGCTCLMCGIREMCDRERSVMKGRNRNGE